MSDLHDGHDRSFILEPRGFGSVQEHSQFIKDQWLSMIDSETTVINLGDSHFGDPDGAKFKDFSLWPCKIQYYLWGNHTSGAKTCFFEVCKGREKYPTMFNNICFVGNQLSCAINGKQFELSHFPKRVWDKMNRGSFHLSGHSHGNDQGRNIGNEFGRCLDIGVENAIKFDKKFFFTFEDIISILGDKENLILDHHE